MIYKTNEELQIACAEWQKRLRLQDWIVKARIARIKEMDDQEAGAECNPYLKRKIAAIRIRDSIDMPDKMIIEQDMEWDLVHELLHLHFQPLNTEDSDEIALEQAVDVLAHSFITLYREKQLQAKKELKVV